jgi:hypothetical protein
MTWISPVADQAGTRAQITRLRVPRPANKLDVRQSRSSSRSGRVSYTGSGMRAHIVRRLIAASRSMTGNSWLVRALVGDAPRVVRDC